MPTVGYAIRSANPQASTYPAPLAQPGKVSLKIYSLTGQLVATLVDNTEHAAGRYQVKADMTRFSSGVYFYVLQQGAKRQARTMVLLK